MSFPEAEIEYVVSLLGLSMELLPPSPLPPVKLELEELNEV